MVSCISKVLLLLLANFEWLSGLSYAESVLSVVRQVWYVLDLVVAEELLRLGLPTFSPAVSGLDAPQQQPDLPGGFKGFEGLGLDRLGWGGAWLESGGASLKWSHTMH